MADPTLDFTDEGHLRLAFGPMSDDWREATCCECGEPVRWVLDMASFKSVPGAYLLGHARCLWMAEAFDSPLHRPPGFGAQEATDA